MPENIFPTRIDLKFETGFAHNFKDLAIQAFRDKKLELPYRQAAGHAHYAPITFSLDNPENTFTKEFLNLDKAIKIAVAEDVEVQDLLKKRNWDRHDRLAWEGRVSDIIVMEMNKSELFKFSNYNASGAEIRNLNDMEIGKNQEYDCEAMALIKGLMSQRVEDMNLMNNSGDGYKKAYPYYFFSSSLIDFDDNKVSGHAAIFAPALGNISDQTALSLNAVKDYSLENFKQSKPIVCFSTFRDGSVTVAKDASQLAFYSQDLDISICVKSDEKMYLSTGQENTFQLMGTYLNSFNATNKKTDKIRKLFLENFEQLAFDLDKMSKKDISAIQKKMAQSLGSSGMTQQEIVNMGLSSIFVKNADDSDRNIDTITYGGIGNNFQSFADDVPTKASFSVPLPKK